MWVRQAIAGLQWPPVGLPLLPSSCDEAWKASSPPDGNAARQPPRVLPAGKWRSYVPLRPSVNAQARPLGASRMCQLVDQPFVAGQPVDTECGLHIHDVCLLPG